MQYSQSGASVAGADQADEPTLILRSSGRTPSTGLADLAVSRSASPVMRPGVPDRAEPLSAALAAETARLSSWQGGQDLAWCSALPGAEHAVKVAAGSGIRHRGRLLTPTAWGCVKVSRTGGGLDWRMALPAEGHGVQELHEAARRATTGAMRPFGGEGGALTVAQAAGFIAFLPLNLFGFVMTGLALSTVNSSIWVVLAVLAAVAVPASVILPSVMRGRRNAAVGRISVDVDVATLSGATRGCVAALAQLAETSPRVAEPAAEAMRRCVERRDRSEEQMTRSATLVQACCRAMGAAAGTSAEAETAAAVIPVLDLVPDGTAAMADVTAQMTWLADRIASWRDSRGAAQSEREREDIRLGSYSEQVIAPAVDAVARVIGADPTDARPGRRSESPRG